MKKNIIILILIVFIFSGCGFKSLLSVNKPVFVIEAINNADNKLISRTISIYLKKLEINNDPNLEKFTINVSSKKEINVTSKDNKGDPTNFGMNIFVYLEFYTDNNLVKREGFESQFNYKNKSNKFDLALYEKNIEKNILKQIIRDINLYILKN